MESPELYTSRTATKTVIRQSIPTEHSSTTELRPARGTPWQDRLAELARLASASLGADSRNSNAGPLIHQHLDAIESILRDPRPRLTDEMTTREGRRHSFRTKSLLGEPDASDLEEPEWLAKTRYDERRCQQMSSELTTLLGEVTTLNLELQQRRKESVQIRELYEDKCRGLTRSVAELEDEVSELHSDLKEDAVELEGMQGTVNGLQNWIEGMRDEQRKARTTRDIARKNMRRWGGRKPPFEKTETGGEMVLDGLSAWMRGWKDVEDGFQVRALGRRNRREQRQQLLRQVSINTAPDDLS
ncbi:hypothetical protein N7493_002731 [Penicillium malachiteum]|uniref:Uncharacterized protein n=1 Tax=Penicillium malachiteum TaxID=1324776 RepID=A0AAD6MZ97_9EURO|nr:hypothetical protein N7493_002731 [Penicillium malachiteum]